MVNTTAMLKNREKQETWKKWSQIDISSATDFIIKVDSIKYLGPLLNHRNVEQENYILNAVCDQLIGMFFSIIVCNL